MRRIEDPLRPAPVRPKSLARVANSSSHFHIQPGPQAWKIGRQLHPAFPPRSQAEPVRELVETAHVDQDGRILMSEVIQEVRHVDPGYILAFVELTPRGFQNACRLG